MSKRTLARFPKMKIRQSGRRNHIAVRQIDDWLRASIGERTWRTAMKRPGASA